MDMSDGSIFSFLNGEFVILLLAFNGGFYDAAGYIQLQGLYTSSMTGNLVAACSVAFKPSDSPISQSMSIVSFFLSCGIMSFVAATFKRHHVTAQSKRRCCILLYSFFALALSIVWILGCIFEAEITEASIRNQPDNAYVVMMGCIMSAAMGVQNISARGTRKAIFQLMTLTLIYY